MERFRFLQIVSDAVDNKTPWTSNHSRRVERFSSMIGRFMGLRDEEVRSLELSARLHDIGKIGVNDTYLECTSHLTETEFDNIKLHPVIGCDLFNAYFLDMLDFGADLEDSHTFIKDVLSVIRHHHEHVDGKGYPDGIKRREISLFAKIVHVADAMDAMIVDRPYRNALGIEYALSEIRRCSGTQFDPEVADVFIKHFEPGMIDTLNYMLNDAYPARVRERR